MIQYLHQQPESIALKDIVTLIVAISALIVSVTSLVTSNRQKKRDNDQKLQDNKLTLRKQLTEVLEKLSNLNIQWGTFDIKRNDYPENFRGILSDQRRFFVRQADYIAKQIDDSVSPVECRLIANGFDAIDDDEQAIYYFEKAIAKAKSSVDNILSRREYARFVSIKSKAEGDKLFQSICDDFPTDKSTDSRLIYYIATVYERWANLRKDDSSFYSDKIILAVAEWEKHKDDIRKKFEIDRLKKLIKSN